MPLTARQMTVLGFGAILWDDIAGDTEQPGKRSVAGERNIGGSVFNVIANLQKLGYRAYMLSAIGNDKLGAKTFDELERLHIQRDFIGTVDAPTCLINVRFDQEGLPHYSSPALVSWDRIEASDEQIEQIKRQDIDVFVFGTLEQRSLTSRDTLQRVLYGAHFGIVYLDLTLRGDFYSRELLDESMRKANIVKMNEEEALIVNSLFSFNQRDPKHLTSLIAREFKNDMVCITQGNRGAVIGDRTASVHRPAYKIDVKDTVGAGDAFSAGLLYMLGKGTSMGEACDFANKMGALISSKKSSIPEYSVSELEHITLHATVQE